MQVAQISLASLIDFALPPRCPSCGVITPEPNRFCSECWQKLHFLTEPSCSTCDLPLPFEPGGSADMQCATCLAQPPRHSGIKAAVAYGDVSREIALKLKHGGKIGLARLIAEALRRHLYQLPSEALLVPVPLHWTRLWARRYNQSALIAGELARLSGREHCPDMLIRTRKTQSLGGLSARERAAMVKNAFVPNRKQQHRLIDRPVILVDDVYTSGATADACTKALLNAGAGSVMLFCWARVLPQAMEMHRADGQLP